MHQDRHDVMCVDELDIARVLNACKRGCARLSLFGYDEDAPITYCLRKKYVRPLPGQDLYSDPRYMLTIKGHIYHKFLMDDPTISYHFQ